MAQFRRLVEACTVPLKSRIAYSLRFVALSQTHYFTCTFAYISSTTPDYGSIIVYTKHVSCAQRLHMGGNNFEHGLFNYKYRIGGNFHWCKFSYELHFVLFVQLSIVT